MNIACDLNMTSKLVNVHLFNVSVLSAQLPVLSQKASWEKKITTAVCQ